MAKHPRIGVSASDIRTTGLYGQELITITAAIARMNLVIHGVDDFHIASGTTLAVGSKVTLHTDGMQVTATTTGGVAEITSIEGQTVGDAVTVKF